MKPHKNGGGRAEAVDIVLDSKEDALSLRVDKLLREAPLTAMAESSNRLTAGALRELASSLASNIKSSPQPFDVQKCKVSSSYENRELSSSDVERVFVHNFNQIQRRLHSSELEKYQNLNSKVDSLALLVSALRRCSILPEVMKDILKNPIISSCQTFLGEHLEPNTDQHQLAQSKSDEIVSVSRMLSTSSSARNCIFLEVLIHNAVKHGTAEALLIAALALLASGLTNLENDGELEWQYDASLHVGSIMALLPISVEDECSHWYSKRSKNLKIDRKTDQHDDLVLRQNVLDIFFKEAVQYEIAREVHKKDEEVSSDDQISINNDSSHREEEPAHIEEVEVDSSRNRFNHDDDDQSDRSESNVDQPNSEQSDSDHDSEDGSDDSDENIEDLSNTLYDNFGEYDEETMLRQALALSLVEHGSVEQEDLEDGSNASSHKSAIIEGPECDVVDSFGQEKDMPLDKNHVDPSSPIDYKPPSSSTFNAGDDNTFGSLPAHSVFLHLLRSAVFLLDSSSCQCDEDEVACEPALLCPGAVGSKLFPVKCSTESRKGELEAKPRSDSILQLLSCIVIILADCRHSVLLASSNASQSSESGFDFKSSNDCDDPADMIRIVKSSDEMDSQTHLANKGFHRKAAAAADAMALKKKEDMKRSLEKLRDLEFLSLSSIMSLKCMYLNRANSISLHLDASDRDPLMNEVSKKMLGDAFEKFYDHALSTSYQLVLRVGSSLSIECCNLALRVWAEYSLLLGSKKSYLENLLISLTLTVSEHGEGKVEHLPWTEETQQYIMFALLSEVCRQDIILNYLLSSTSSACNLLKHLNSFRSSKLYFAIIHIAISKFILNGNEGIDWIKLFTKEGSESAIGKIVFSGKNIGFDASRSSDSVAIKKSDEGNRSASVLQRASKKWGTILSDTPISPNTGIHRFAIRLDHCEKGHIFVGIATSQASMDSYVGSDRHGWGLIGTQALWHNRSKIRSDYGSPFRSGDIIIVTLNTNNGSLSFGVLKDTDKCALSFDGASKYEDWGTAFEGLPIDANLFPAVGLYQRDDKVTILSINGPASDNVCSSTGISIEPSRRGTDILQFVNGTLLAIKSMLDQPMNRSGRSFILQVLPALGAGICMMENSEHLILMQIAVNALPVLTHILEKLNDYNDDESVNRNLFSGEWLIRAFSPSGSNVESYSLDIEKGSFERNQSYIVKGKGKGEAGKSKGGSVQVFGIVEGVRLRFMELWSKESKNDSNEAETIESYCSIDSRLNTNHTSFEGAYTTQGGQSYAVAGVKKYTSRETHNSMIICKRVVGLCIAHLSAFLSGKQMEEFIDKLVDSKFRKKSVARWMESNLFSNGFLDENVGKHLSDLQRCLIIPTSFTSSLQSFETINKEWWKKASAVFYGATDHVTPVEGLDPKLDEWVSRCAGGNGFFRSFADDNFVKARQFIVTSLLHHTSSVKHVQDEYNVGSNVSDETVSIWRTSLTIFESEIRKLSQCFGVLKACKEASQKLIALSKFLLKIKSSPFTKISEVVEFYENVSVDNIDEITLCLQASTKKAICRTIGLASIRIAITGCERSKESSVTVIDSCLTFLPLLTRHRIITDLVRRCRFKALQCWNVERMELYSMLTIILKEFSVRTVPSIHVTSLILSICSCLSTVISSTNDALYLAKPLVESLLDTINADCTSISTFHHHLTNSAQLSDHFDTKKCLKAKLSSLNILISQLFSEISRDKIANFDENIDVIKVVVEINKQLQMFADISQKSEALKKDHGMNLMAMKDIIMCCNENLVGHPKQKTENLINKNHIQNIEFHSICSLLNKDNFFVTSSDDIVKETNEDDITTAESCIIELLFLVRNLLCCSARELMRRVPVCDTLLCLIGINSSQKPLLPTISTRKVLRLLRKLLPLQNARADVVRALLIICCDSGIITDTSNYIPISTNERRINEEARNLLRVLCIESKQWSDLIAEVVNDVLESNDESAEVLGALAFLGGTPSTMSRGSFVLINSEISRTKGSTVSGKVENIVRSISHRTSSAGVVSDVNINNNTCEVVLFENRKYRDWSSINFKDDILPSMAVRAIRTSLDDVTLVNEIPLVIKPKAHIKTVSSLLLKLRNAMEKKADASILESQCSLKSGLCEVLILRSLSSLLCNENILDSCMENREQILSVILSIIAADSDEDESNRNLSFITSIERRYVQRLRQLFDLTQRKMAVESQSLPEVERLIVSMKASNNSNKEELNDDENFLDGDESVSTAETNNDHQQPSEDDIQAAIAQMTELGLPRTWAELSLRRTGGANVEAAVHFCLEHGTEIEQMIAEEVSRERQSTTSGLESGQLLQQLQEMGFPTRWCAEALAATRNNVDEALTWILTNGDRLAQLDENGRTEDEEAASDEENYDSKEVDDSDEYNSEDEADEDSSLSSHNPKSESGEGMKDFDFAKCTWNYPSPCPIQFVSGRSDINKTSLEIAGLSSSGFSSVGTKGIIHTSGKWYYEVLLLTAGCLQIGWADSSFAGHCQADTGDGVGDGPSSWAFDGWRRYKWHSIATEWGCRWQEGDVIGCAVDMDAKTISFTINGRGEEIGMGTAFDGEGFKPSNGVYACVSFNRRERLKFILGGGGDIGGLFKYGPPPGFRGVGEAVVNASEEFSRLLEYEKQFLTCKHNLDVHFPLCDFSDGEHGHELFAWQHRYYGSDASVHLAASKRKSKDKNISDSKTKVRPDAAQLIWKKEIGKGEIQFEADSIVEFMRECYVLTEKKIVNDILSDLKEMLVLYARKLFLQLMLHEKFNLKICHCISVHTKETELGIANQIWSIIESSCGLLKSGWVGEAGVMAVAAETLGLGISSNESQKTSMQNGHLSLNLTSAWITDNPRETSNNIAAAAEAAICGINGGGLLFLKEGLQTACASSSCLRNVITAAIRKSVISLASIGIKDILSEATENENQLHSNTKDDLSDSTLILFMTGLLVSDVVRESMTNYEWDDLVLNLLEGWSAGLLSGSIPFRMICALVAAGLINFTKPSLFSKRFDRFPTILNFYQRLPSIVARRIWAERAAVPTTSRYIQALLELFTSVKNIGWDKFHPISFDAATPSIVTTKKAVNWEEEESWIQSDDGWQIWLGVVEYFPVESLSDLPRSTVSSMMDEGKGPPMLREGCLVCRGIDWDLNNDDDDRKGYEIEKLALKNKISSKNSDISNKEAISLETEQLPLKKKRTRSAPKLPLGTVLSIESWDGVPGMGRRVRWHRSGKENIYRFGGGGGKFDICHVEPNEKKTKILQKHPYPESLEQIMSRNGFGKGRKFNLTLRIHPNGEKLINEDNSVDEVHNGVLEWPDFGAGISVSCVFHADGAMTLKELSLLYGSKHSGWEARFGQPDYIPGSIIILSPINNTTQSVDETNSCFTQQNLGSCSHLVSKLRDSKSGNRIRVTSEMRFWRRKMGKTSESCSPSLSSTTSPVALTFDQDYHAPNICISQNGRMATCTSADGRCVAFGSTGFSKGVHYWEVKLEQADVGSVFIGVAEKPSRMPLDSSNLLRWTGWGFVNFRATYTSGIERIYGSHTSNGDIIGVLLDCDNGRISFFYDGVKYGEHILNDLGVAFTNLSPFGFNADGCGSGGAGQGAPSGLDGGSRASRYPANGAVRAQSLWPVIGFKNREDRVIFTGKWISNYGPSCVDILRNVIKVDEIFQTYGSPDKDLPEWLKSEGFQEYRSWSKSSLVRSSTRACSPIPLCTPGLEVVLNTSPKSCASACAALGMNFALMSGEKVEVKRCQGRILELPEIAEVLGTLHGRLFYRLVSQKSEGGSLVEGGGRSWFWDESEIAENGLVRLDNEKYYAGIKLPLLDRFTCYGQDLHIVYEKGALMRSDLEIDYSESTATIPYDTVISNENILDCRLNSSCVLRYKVKFEGSIGWISDKIRGGSEQSIVKRIPSKENVCPNVKGGGDCRSKHERIIFPEDSANIWFEKFVVLNERKAQETLINFEEFNKFLEDGVICGMSVLESDSVLSEMMSAIEATSPNCSFENVFMALDYICCKNAETKKIQFNSSELKSIHDAISLTIPTGLCLPHPKALMARLSMLRNFNRRAKLSLAWFPFKPIQEGSALFGGRCGYGASVDRVGRGLSMDTDKWVTVSSMASRVRRNRKILFTGVKRIFLNSVIGATSTPTPMSTDEYELPREIRTVHINRIKARRARDDQSRKKNSVFSQLKHEMKGWNGAWLRRSYIAKGHGGQKRAFKVKFVGEGVNDYSGPYREVFADALSGIQEISGDKNYHGILKPSPNTLGEIGDNRGLLIFSAPKKNKIYDESFLGEPKAVHSIANFFRSSIGAGDDTNRELEEELTFLGRLVATACRHGIQVDLKLPKGLVWSKLAEDYEGLTSFNDMLAEVDLLESRFSIEDKNFNSKRAQHLLDNQQRMLNVFSEGMAGVLPIELFCLFTQNELKDVICGNADIDVDLLMSVVEYEGGYTQETMVIKYFWEVLREMSSKDRKLFLQFVSARSCLPSKKSDFESPFKIVRDAKMENNSEALPTASTCFFTLTLPEYSSKSVLREKLLFAIRNGYTMESDFVTNNTEVEKGWRE